MPRRVPSSTARPAAATATATTVSSTPTTTTIIANSTTAEEGSATAGPSSSKSLPPAQAACSPATSASASASTSKLGDGTQATASRHDVLCPRARVGAVPASALVMLIRISSRRSVDAVRSLHHPLPLILPMRLLPRYAPLTPSPTFFLSLFP